MGVAKELILVLGTTSLGPRNVKALPSGRQDSVLGRTFFGET